MKNIWRILRGLTIGAICLSATITHVEVRAETEETLPILIISAVNAGYTGVDGSAQNYDFVELYNIAGEPILLDGFELKYTNSAGNATIYSFASGTVLNAEFLTLGYNGSPQFAGAEADYRYKFNLSADTGTVSLVIDGKVADEVCWGNASCEAKFGKFSTKEADNLSLARCMVDGEPEMCGDGKSFEFRKYYPDPSFDVLMLPEPEDEESEMGEGDMAAQCMGLIFTEIYAYFEVDYAEQFVEIYNSTDEIVPLDGCAISYKNKFYDLTGELYPNEYLGYRNADLKLTKNPTSNNVLTLADANGADVASLTYLNGQKKATSYAFFGTDESGIAIWRQTYAITPAEENVYQEFKSCPTGKVTNPLTGNCINFFEEEPLPDCPAGKFRNPETNRCKSYETLSSILAPCAEGYFRNPETNRCKKIVTTTELKPCDEGWERNPETNRCRKIRENDGADYGVQPTAYTDKSSFIGYGALAAAVTGGVLYIVLQFRHEIGKFLRKLWPRRVKMKS